jgi:hypothetical protein
MQKHDAIYCTPYSGKLMSYNDTSWAHELKFADTILYLGRYDWVQPCCWLILRSCKAADEDTNELKT